jgi:hypothetical protein
MPHANTVIPPQAAKHFALLISILIGFVFVEGWLAGAAPLHAGNTPTGVAAVVHAGDGNNVSNVALGKPVPAAPPTPGTVNEPPAAVIPAAAKNASAILTASTAPAVATPPVVPPMPALTMDPVSPPGIPKQNTERRRDPFRPLVRSKDAATFVGPPGKAGLSVNTLQVQGTLRDQDGMTAIVANSQGHVYFLHPGDQIYDAVVREIRPGAVIFQQRTQDAFGHPVEHIVTRLLGPASGGTP